MSAKSANVQANAISQVFGHGWLCHPTSRRGRFSENFNLSTGFVIQGIKVQTLIHFYDSLYQQKASILIATFPKTEIGPLADTYSYADWQRLQWLPVTPTFASPVHWDKAEGLAVSRPISRRPHSPGRGNCGLNIQIDSIGFGGSRIEQNLHPIFFYTLFLYSSYFLEFIGHFLQPPAFGHR